jgi:hypothetical protein
MVNEDKKVVAILSNTGGVSYIASEYAYDGNLNNYLVVDSITLDTSISGPDRFRVLTLGKHYEMKVLVTPESHTLMTTYDKSDKEEPKMVWDL